VLSTFKAGGASPVDLKTLALPVGLGMSWRHVDAGADYQPTFDLENGRRSDGYGTSIGGGAGNFHVNASVRRDVQLPTLNTFLSSVPGLEEALQRSGIYVTDVNQIIQYLRDTAFLVALGFASDLRFNVAPARVDATLNADYLGLRGRLNLNVLDSRTEVVTGESRLRSASLAYTRQISDADEVSCGASIVEIHSGTLTDTTHQFAIAYRHRFASVPPLTYRRRGRISGHVFRDDESAALWSPEKTGIAGAAVRLDDDRTVQTDASGFYSFDNVAPRPHRVSVSVPSTLPFTFTADSPRITDVNTIADFGVAFLQGKLFGRVLNDAGAGVPGVVLKLQGSKTSATVQSGDNGDYSFPNLPDGAYWISAVPDSFPIGYDLLSLAEDPILVRDAAPTQFDLFVKALRTVSGTVSLFDPKSGSSSPGEEIRVSIPELSRTALTNATGRYRFTDLPAGTFTVEVVTATNRYTQRVTLSAAPMTLANTNFTVVGR
jgi:Carboxypeptidase regulatory-like domain